jgi:hypothetical protein
MLLAGQDSIREVIAFPKAASGLDPLTGAPTPISKAQRKEAGIDTPPAAVKPSGPQPGGPPANPTNPGSTGAPGVTGGPGITGGPEATPASQNPAAP